jgi:hypothetical protein
LIIVRPVSPQAIDGRVSDDAVEEVPCAHWTSFRRGSLRPRSEGIGLSSEGGQPTGGIEYPLEHGQLRISRITVLHQQSRAALDDTDGAA